MFDVPHRGASQPSNLEHHMGGTSESRLPKADGSITWNLKMEVLKMTFLFNWVKSWGSMLIFRGVTCFVWLYNPSYFIRIGYWLSIYCPFIQLDTDVLANQSGFDHPIFQSSGFIIQLEKWIMDQVHLDIHLFDSSGVYTQIWCIIWFCSLLLVPWWIFVG